MANPNTCGIFSLVHLFNMFFLAGDLSNTNLTVSTKGLQQQVLQACLPSPDFSIGLYTVEEQTRKQNGSKPRAFPIAQCQSLE